MKKTFVAILSLFAVLQADAGAPAIISEISAPIQYDSGNYYAYAAFDTSVSWDMANELVRALPAYNGLPPQLATFPTDARYTWFVSQEANFTSPSIGSWDTAWIGATNVSGSSYAWVNDLGSIPTNSPHWGIGQPLEGNSVVSWALADYGNFWQAHTAADSSIGNAIIQYTDASSTPMPPVISSQPVSAVVTTGSVVSLSVSNNGTAPFGYQWLKDGAILSGQTNSTLSFSSFNFTDSGSYSVVITNAQGMTISFPASLSIANAPLQGWGRNDAAQLNRFPLSNTNRPTLVTSNVVAAAGGVSHSLFLNTTGALWGSGATSSGQLGGLPVSNVAAAAGGANYSLFVKADGTLWAMGYNYYGQLGNGTTADTNLPVQVASNVVAVAAGGLHSLFVKADGTLWGMGYNEDGQLGNGTTNHVNLPVQVASNVVATACGWAHSLFVKADGTLWAMGYNYYGQLGNGTTANTTVPVQVASNVVAAAGGDAHSLFVKTDGTLWAMGRNNYGQLGNGTLTDTNLPVQVAGNVVAASGGSYHTLFVKADGTLWAMGRNNYGQLGNGTWSDTNLPVQVASLLVASLAKEPTADHSLAIALSLMTDQTITFPAIGDKLTTDTVGLSATASSGLTVSFSVLSGPGSISVGTNLTFTGAGTVSIVASQAGDSTYNAAPSVTNLIHVYALSANSGAYAGGNTLTITNGNIGTITNVLVGGVQATITASGANWFAITLPATGSTGAKDIVVQTSDNGDTTLVGAYTVNPAGVIGIECDKDPQVAISAGNDHSLALKTDGSIIGWGGNIFGQTNAPTGTNYVAVAAGVYYSLALKTDGSIIGWGRNDSGQTSAPAGTNYVAVAAGGYHSLALKTDGSIIGWGSNLYGQTNAPAGTNFVAVAAGYYHSLALKTDGSIIGWGDNTYGQTNAPAGTNYVAVAAGRNHSLALKTDGSIIGWGDNTYGQTNAPAGTNFVAVAAGYYHSLVLKTDGSIIGWGRNDSGQTNAPAGTNFVAVAAGYLHSLALKTDGSIIGWGDNGNGRTAVPAPNTDFGVTCGSGVAPSSGSVTGGYEVVISGANLGNGSDITSVTLCGVGAASITSQSSTQIVVLAGVGTVGLGDVRVFSTSYGETVKSNAFTYLKADQTITFPTIGNKVTTDTVGLSATASSGLPVTFTTNGGPVIITGGTNLTFSGAGLVSIVASQAGNGSWNSAPNVTNTFTVTAALLPPSISSQPVSAVVTMGGAASLSVSNNGTAPFGYQWLKDGVILTNQTSSTLSFSSFQFTDSGSYSVVITNAQGLVISLPANLSVPNAPLRVWGKNGNGQLGDGTNTNTNRPIVVASNVVAAAGGQFHSLFVKEDGTLWAMGYNYYGQLGNGANTDANRPVQVASNVVAAAGGWTHSLFVKEDGTLWAMGRNQFGQLGNGTTTDTNRPVQVASNVVAVAGVYEHSLFLKADGTLWAMGRNQFGQLGNGTTTDTNRPVQVASNVMVAAGSGADSLFLKTDGTLWGVGDNTSGQLGDSTTTSRSSPIQMASNVVTVAGGGAQSLFVKVDRTLWAVGLNNYGQLGDGTTTNTNRPIQVASNVVVAAGGQFHSLFVKADGTLWAMGRNNYGQLGDRTTSDSSVPVLVQGSLVASLAQETTADHSLAIAGVLPMASVANRTVTFGQATNFTAFVTEGDGPFTYQWQFGGTNVVNATNATYAIASAALTNAGNYAVVVAGTYGTTTSSVATLTVDKANQTITFPAISDKLSADTVGLTATASSGLPVTFTTNGGPAVITGSANLTFTGAGTVSIVASQAGDSSYNAAPNVTNLIHVYALSANSGAYAGGNSLTITNGNIGTITNVLVGGVQAPITASGANWFTITLPATGSTGAKDIVVQTSDNGDITLAGAYTVNPAGMIGIPASTSGWTNLSSGPNAAVLRSLCASTNGDLYALGYFTAAGGVPAKDIAKWSGGSWTNLGAGIDLSPWDYAAMSIGPNGDLYAGGDFTTAGGTAANYVAKWDGSTWTNLGAGMNAKVFALASGSNGDLYAGGRFTTAGGTAANRIAKWNGSSWTNLGAGMNDSVQSLLVAPNGDLYAGGSFTTAGGTTASNIAKWNGSTWTNLGAGMNLRVYALAIGSNGDLYAGGSFTTAGGTVANRIAKWNGSSWTNLGAGMNSTVYALAIGSNGDLYAGGEFTTAGGATANRVAKWDGNTWTNLSTGVEAVVYGLAPAPNGGVYAGGNFTTAGGLTVNGVAQWGSSATGVAPSSGICTGGYPVTITGTNLGSGSDITNVTLCSISAAIVSQSATQVIVTAVAGSVGLGDVRVFSTSYGETVKSNAFTYLKADQTISFPNIGNQLTTNVVTLSATATSGLSVTNFSVVSGPAVVSGSSVSFTNSGAVVLSAIQNGSTNYNASAATNISFSVTKATASVSLSNTNQTYDGTAKSVAVATVPVGKTVSVTYDGSATVPSNAASYAVVATVNEAMYQGGATGTLTIAKASQTVSFPNIGDQLTTNVVSLIATATSGLAVTNFSVVSGPAVISAGSVSFTNSGSVTLSAIQNGNTNYNASAATNISFSVTKATASVSLSNTNQMYDGTAKSVTATTVPSGLSVTVTYDGGATVPSNVASYAVVATVNEAMYQGGATGTLTIVKANQTISFPNIGSQLTTNIVTLGATASSGLSVTNFSVVSGPAVVSGSSVSFTNSGAVVLSAIQNGSTNYNASAATNISFSVTKATASVSLSGTNQTYNGTARVVTAVTVPSGQAVDITYDGSVTAPTNAGNYTVIGTVNELMYQGSTTGTLMIAKANQTISFPNIGNQEANNKVGLAATATSALTVSFAVSSGPAVISSGTNLSFSSLGSVSVLANQSGDSNWNGAPVVTNTFDVIGVITNVSPASGTLFGGTQVTISGRWLGNGTDITNVTLCNIAATIVTQDIHSVVVTTGPSPVETNADVVVQSAGFGTVTLVKGFTYQPVPPPPVALSAVDITSDRFTARWTASDRATNYLIDVSQSSAFTSYTGVYNNRNVGDVTACMVTGLTDGETYWYRVRAANQYGASTNSNVIEVPVSTNTPYIKYELTNGIASAGSSDVVDMTKFFHGAGMTYTVTSNSNPGLVAASFSGLNLILDYTPGVSGSARITVRATDSSTGFWVENTITVSVAPAPGLTLGSIALNRQNGLYEQIATVSNTSPTLAARAVTLTVTNLSAGASLYNATGTDEHGNPEIQWIGTLAPGGSMNFTLQYYTARRGTVPSATVLASLSLEDPQTVISGSTFDLSATYQNIDGTQAFLIEFAAVPGRTYYIQYTDALANPWKTVQPKIVAPVNRIQWIDSGPPGTESAPGSVPTRFYRVIEAAE